MTTHKEAKLVIWRQILACTLASEEEILEVVHAVAQPTTLREQRTVMRAWNDVINELAAKSTRPRKVRDELDAELMEALK